MPADKTSASKVARVGTRRSPRDLLPHNYVPPCPRTSTNIFAAHFFLLSKKSHPTRPTEAIMKKACNFWMDFSEEDKLPYEMLAKAEMDLRKTRFPEGRERQKRPRVPFALQWSVATDHLFVIDAQGAIQYAPRPVDDAPMFVPYEVDGQSYMGSSNCVGGQLSIVDDDLMDCDPPTWNTASSGSDYDLSPLIVPKLLSYTEPEEDREAIDYDDATVRGFVLYSCSSTYS
ncbi:hypothetical protein BDZ89DRAFT_1076609 [Hymenopellis radicata]|nr:hypothetical protein BDZ89DRAFT_1076609 [Hymenopellis radicata]